MIDVGLDLHAVGDQPVDLGLDDVLRQAELGDAVDQDAAGGVERLEDRDLRGRAWRARRPRSGRPARSRRSRPLAGRLSAGRGSASSGCACAQSATKRSRWPMATGVALLRPQADALALGLLGADPAGDAGQGVVVEERVGRSRAGRPRASRREEARDVDADRAAVDAVRLRALEAALGLEHRDLLGSARG